jgi:hypothetical protein
MACATRRQTRTATGIGRCRNTPGSERKGATNSDRASGTWRTAKNDAKSPLNRRQSPVPTSLHLPVSLRINPPAGFAGHGWQPRKDARQITLPNTFSVYPPEVDTSSKNRKIGLISVRPDCRVLAAEPPGNDGEILLHAASPKAGLPLGFRPPPERYDWPDQERRRLPPIAPRDRQVRDTGHGQERSRSHPANPLTGRAGREPPHRHRRRRL